MKLTTLTLIFTMIALLAIGLAASAQASLSEAACTVYYHAGVVTCAQPPISAATLTALSETTATQKPPRERSSDAGYPAPGDSTATVEMPYPPPISGDPNETQPPIQTPDFEATYQADLCMHAGLCTATPTSTPRPTPTLAPTMDWPAP